MSEGLMAVSGLVRISHSQKMASIHINRDFRHALRVNGVGLNENWACIGTVIKKCESEMLNKLKRFLNDNFMRRLFDVSEIRDAMRKEIVEDHKDKGVESPFEGNQ